MPRSPHDPVIRDSQETQWNVFREGLYHDDEVSASGHWHPSRVGTPWQSIRATTPFGRQQPHGVLPVLSIVPPSPLTPPTPPVRTPLGEVLQVQVNACCSELATDDRKRAAVDAALCKIREGMRELELAQKM